MLEFRESLYPRWGQFFQVDRVLFEHRSGHQHVVIFENADFGRVLALDGVIQTTEKDEFVYHEMMAHVPIFAHGRVRKVLIVGGGDGGMLREVLRHRSVEHVTQVEIDKAVIDTCVEFLPNHSQGAFEDPRVKIVIDDGLEYVSRTTQTFDVIISDATDPIGPGEALFTQQFYAGCRKALAEGGVLVTQNGNAFRQLEEVTTTAMRLSLVGEYADCTFYTAAVPTYVGGIMAFAWAATDPALRQTGPAIIAQRFEAAAIDTRYYTPEIHSASFALPAFVRKAISQAMA